MPFWLLKRSLQGIAINVAGNKMYIAVQNGAITRADLDGSNPTAWTLGGLPHRNCPAGRRRG